jgi:hypothetical protein
MNNACLRAASLAAILTLAPSGVASAQSLRGSLSSIDRMYRQARAERLHFYETAAGVRRAAGAGRLVRLAPGEHVALHEVGYPFVKPATRTFVQRLGAQYHAACGEPLTVTSAVRPATRQPANATARSVHPTGMAVDLRKPQVPACLRWLRTTLLALERAELIEATEETAPAHFHVAVFLAPYARYAAARQQSERRVLLATRRAAGATTYTVREGDTLWDIARTHDTTVDAIASSNAIDGEIIVPGQELRIPTGG